MVLRVKGLNPLKVAGAAAICFLAIAAALFTSCRAPQPGVFHKRSKAAARPGGAAAPNVNQAGSDNSY